MVLKPNMCKFDRGLRLILGAGLIYLGFIDTAIIGNSLACLLVGLFGVANIIFAFMGHCPVYMMANIGTLHQKDCPLTDVPKK